MSVYCDGCVLSGSGLCDGLIARPEDFYLIVVCLSVISKPQQSEGLGRFVEQRGKNIHCTEQEQYRISFKLLCTLKWKFRLNSSSHYTGIWTRQVVSLNVRFGGQSTWLFVSQH